MKSLNFYLLSCNNLSSFSMSDLSDEQLARFSDESVQKLKDLGLEVVELQMFSFLELTGMGLTPKEIALLRLSGKQGPKVPKRPRPEPDVETDESNDERDDEYEEEHPKNGEALLILSGLTVDSMGFRSFLPNRWEELGELGLRSQILAGAAGRVENPHLRRELDFLISLAGVGVTTGAPEHVKILVWGRLCQLILKVSYPPPASTFPQSGMEV